MSRWTRRLYAGVNVFFLMLMPALALSANAADKFYQQHNLVSDGFVPADNLDPHLINAWGIVFGPTNPVWDQGSGVATLYDGLGHSFPPPPQGPLVLNIPKAPNHGPATGPTDIVFNDSTGFVVEAGSASGPARFVFATLDGLIAGWAPNVDLHNAIVAVPASVGTFTGLALANNGIGMFLYVADIRNARIAAFDSNFHPATLSGSFADPAIPPGFGPYGIHNIDRDLYVTYARQDRTFAKGLGFVNVFHANGNLIRRVASRGKLNGPWAVALAPAAFGKFSNHLLVGNFGDGTIDAFDPATGKFRGQLKGTDRQPLKIDGLWALRFGNGLLDQPADVLFFSAGPGNERHGLYGNITAVAATGQEDDGDNDDDWE
jgi:uncharacterized protein (TIGR03118 family)